MNQISTNKLRITGSLPLILLLLAIALLIACAAPPKEVETSSPTPQRGTISTRVLNPLGGSTVEEAHAQLEQQGDEAYLVLVSRDSPGTQGIIWWDLETRGIRATTGPDEGIDTQGVSCYPDCLFVRIEDSNSLSVATWSAVLHHEYRHIEQARNNPEMAHDFRGGDGRFTPFAAFQEACADYGINVKASYHAQERIDALNLTLGSDLDGVLDQACRGQKWAYRLIVDQYNERRQKAGAFNELFPPFE